MHANSSSGEAHPRSIMLRLHERDGVLSPSRLRQRFQIRADAQRLGVNSAITESLRPSRPGKIASRYSLLGTPSRRQDSTMERIAATFGPAWALPTCSQFLRPKATGRIEFSARLLDSSTSA